jgi:hypothetical protein
MKITQRQPICITRLKKKSSINNISTINESNSNINMNSNMNMNINK